MLARVPLWFHTFALGGSVHPRGRARPPLPGAVPAGRSERRERPRRRHVRRLLCVPRRVARARAGSSPSTTSSTATGFGPGGTSSSREVRACERSPSCSTPRSSTCASTPSISTSSTSVRSRALLRHPAPGREPARPAAHPAANDSRPPADCCSRRYGVDVGRAAPAIEVHGPGEVYAHDDYVYWGFGGAGLGEARRSRRASRRRRSSTSPSSTAIHGSSPASPHRGRLPVDHLPVTGR